MARPDFYRTRSNVRQTLAALYAVLLAAVAGMPLAGRAAVKTWSGEVSGDWINGSNWLGGEAPVDGDDLVFPSAAARFISTNDFPLLQPRSLTFDGSNYVLHGNAMVLTHGITQVASRTNAINFGIICAANQTNSCVHTAAVLVVNGDIALEAGKKLTVSGPGTNLYGGVISGAGAVFKTGTGLLRYQGGGGNSYSGATTISDGLLQLAKTGGATAIAGNLIIGANATPATVRYLAADQVANGADDHGEPVQRAGLERL
jgi:autotransporter-associated beta strand protein